MENEKKIYIKHSFELLIWLIIILLIVIFCKYSRYSSMNSLNTYNIFMPDVDGLIVGSPVRMMGIEVGHVIKIKPTHDEVFVKFIITNDEIKLPQGTVATVEFSGMAGSKSLELYLPDKETYIDKDTPILSVQPPKRLHDAFGMLNNMFKKIGEIIYTSSSFSEKIKTIDFPEQTSKGDLNNFLEYTNKIIDDATTSAENLQKKLNKKEDKNGK